VRAIINSVSEGEREWCASLSFAMLSPLLGIPLALLVLFVFPD
jgi:hypothetical protein